MQAALDDPLALDAGEMFAADEKDVEVAAAGIAPDPGEPPPRLGGEGPRRAGRGDARRSPRARFAHKGGKRGIHTEEPGYILAEMQFLQRAYPGATW